MAAGSCPRHVATKRKLSTAQVLIQEPRFGWRSTSQRDQADAPDVGATCPEESQHVARTNGVRGLEHFDAIETHRALLDDRARQLTALNKPCAPQKLVQANSSFRHSSCQRAANEDCSEPQKANRDWRGAEEDATFWRPVLRACALRKAEAPQ